MSTHIEATALAVILLISLAQPAGAADTVCTSILDGVHDNIVVPEGTQCDLIDALVRGNVEVKQEGSLSIRGRTSIRGNVQSDGGRYVRLLGGLVSIGGNVLIKKAWESSGYEPGTRIEGSFQYEENAGRLFAAGGLVRGDFQVFKNSGGGSVAGNTIRSNLQCKENFPAPTGGGNSVGGNQEDQCASL